MKKLLFVLLFLASCNTVQSDSNYVDTKGYIIYSHTTDTHRIFDVHQSNLDEELISVSINDLPFEPIRMQLFYFEGECKKFTNVCTVDKIIGVSWKYPN